MKEKEQRLFSRSYTPYWHKDDSFIRLELKA